MAPPFSALVLFLAALFACSNGLEQTFTVAKFERLVDTGDLRDVAVQSTHNYTLVWAYGQSIDFDYENAEKGFVKEVFLYGQVSSEDLMDGVFNASDYDNSITLEANTYDFYWSINQINAKKTYFSGAMVVKTGGWIGLGLSNNTDIEPMDFYEASYDPSTQVELFVDRWGSSFDVDEPLKDKKQEGSDDIESYEVYSFTATIEEEEIIELPQNTTTAVPATASPTTTLSPTETTEGNLRGTTSTPTDAPIETPTSPPETTTDTTSSSATTEPTTDSSSITTTETTTSETTTDTTSSTDTLEESILTTEETVSITLIEEEDPTSSTTDDQTDTSTTSDVIVDPPTTSDVIEEPSSTTTSDDVVEELTDSIVFVEEEEIVEEEEEEEDGDATTEEEWSDLLASLSDSQQEVPLDTEEEQETHDHEEHTSSTEEEESSDDGVSGGFLVMPRYWLLQGSVWGVLLGLSLIIKRAICIGSHEKSD